MDYKFWDKKYRLMAPGPVPVSESVLSEMAQPMIHHRIPLFEEILKTSLVLLQDFFQTKQPVMMLPGTGSAGMEAALVNSFSPGDEILVIVSGKFGERWGRDQTGFISSPKNMIYSIRL